LRRAAPASRLIVDANEGWQARHLREVMPELAACASFSPKERERILAGR